MSANEFTDRLDRAATTERGLTFGSVEEPERRTWREIRQEARLISGYLDCLGIDPGMTVAVLIGCAGDAAAAAQALWLRGVAFTMLQQPARSTKLEAWAEQAAGSCELVGARYCLVGQPFEDVIDVVAAALAMHGIRCVRIGDAKQSSHSAHVVQTRDNDIAMRQLTSGSTGAAKAVSISFANLIANTDALSDAIGIEPDRDISVSWLPLAHDMGMVAFLIGPMLLGSEAVVISPEEFLRQPANWAKLIGRHRATVTCGPSSSYRVLARTLDRLPDGAVDLSALRVAINGAEPIDHRDVGLLAQAGRRFGLRPTAMTPAFGMAETTLAITFSSYLSAPRIDAVSRSALTQMKYALPFDDGAAEASALRLVSVGRPVKAMDVRTVNDAGHANGLREVGRIEVCGPAVAENYTTRSGPQRLARDDGWFDTGDLGYFDEFGELYICGRSKDVIIINGTNLYPTDIEYAAAEIEGVRFRGVAALAIGELGQREGFVVLAETHYHPNSIDQPHMTEEIARHVFHRVGYRPHHVQLLRAGSLPKTSSGKLRRDDARALIAFADESS